MAVGAIHEGNFDRAQYEQVCAEVWPEGLLPEGLLYHAAGPSVGGWVVVEIWASEEAMGRFSTERLGPAARRANISAQTRTFQVVNTRQP